MDIAGSEIGQKMRSAIKAKLTELGCYVDDELPDYVMVMVANKRTRAQMSDDLQLFLGSNTVVFVNWLHQVLKKLQEVTITNTKKEKEQPPKEEPKTSKTKANSKEKKVKEKKLKKASKEKHKRSDGTKKPKKDSKKKDKDKKKLSKKSKKKSKSDEVIRPVLPPLLMNLEKDSEPSITDVFAGQILKNHGVTLESITTDETKELEDIKPTRKALKRNTFPIIDPATVSNVTESLTSADKDSNVTEPSNAADKDNVESEPLELTTEATDIQKEAQKAKEDLENMPREEQIREMNEIEAKIQGLKKKLADQMDSMSEDEDFLNIRTEAEELMNDFAEDVLQEISEVQNTASATPPIKPQVPVKPTVFAAPVTQRSPETLPHIELKLPKRPLRDRLGSKTDGLERKRSNDERLTPERPIEKPISEKVTRRPVDLPERREDFSLKRLNSRVSVAEESGRTGPASVVRVRPRPRGALPAASSLLMRAVADAHKSLFNVAPTHDKEPQVKRALVLPMRRAVEKNIVIQVQTNAPRVSPTVDDGSDCEIDLDTESLTDLADSTDYKSNQEYVPEPVRGGLLSQRMNYVPSHAESPSLDDDVIKIHTTNTEREPGPQFVVTLDGLDPNIFLAKKLKTEGLTDEIELRPKKPLQEKPDEKNPNKPDAKTVDKAKPEKEKHERIELKSAPVKRKVDEQKETAVKKTKPNPIVFDVKEVQKEKEVEIEESKRQRKDSVSSDVTVTTSTSHKYDSIPSLSAVAPAPAAPGRRACRQFPACRYGAACLFAHPRCKHGAACARPRCAYSHAARASQVVPASNYKAIVAAPPSAPPLCKYHPTCANHACAYLHPKACRYGKHCINRAECNFYHHDAPSLKWKSANA